MRPSLPRSAATPGRPPDSPAGGPWSTPPARDARRALLRAALFALILLAVGAMALLRHQGAVLPTNLVALVLMALIYAFVRLEPPRRPARPLPLPS